MIFSRKGRNAVPNPEPVKLVRDLDEPIKFDAKSALGDVRADPEPGRALRLLDDHLAEIEAQGCLNDALDLLDWVEDHIHDSQQPPGYLAMVAGVRQRLAADGLLADSKLEAELRSVVGLYEQALQGYSQIGDEEAIAVVQNNTANALVELARFDRSAYSQAIPLLEEALAFYRQNQDELRRAFIWMALGEAYGGLEEHGADHLCLARDCYENAWSLFERGGSRLDLAEAQARIGDMQLALARFDGDGALERGIRHYRNALSVFLEIEAHDKAGICHAGLGEAYVRLSDMQSEHLRKGVRAFERALEMFEISGNDRARADSAVELARLCEVVSHDEEAADLARAVSLYFQALAVYDNLGLDPERAVVLRSLARVYLFGGADSDPQDVSQALYCLHEAARLLQGSDLADRLQIDEELTQALELAEHCAAR